MRMSGAEVHVKKKPGCQEAEHQEDFHMNHLILRCAHHTGLRGEVPHQGWERTARATLLATADR